MNKMDSNFKELIDDAIHSINLDPNGELTQLKIRTILEFITELKDLPWYLYFIVLFLLACSHCQMDDDLKQLYQNTNLKIANFLLNYNYFPLTENKVKEYYDPNIANAILPLTELSANIHKSGDIVHFVERKYVDATGRKFVAITEPDYNERQSLLQFKLNERLKSE